MTDPTVTKNKFLTKELTSTPDQGDLAIVT